MNNDLISREALKKTFAEECCGCCDNCSHCMTGYRCELIDNAPTVPIPIDQNVWESGYECGKNERLQGEWTHHEEYTNNRPFYITECSFCKLRVQEETNFCPNCGADMRKGGAE